MTSSRPASQGGGVKVSVENSPFGKILVVGSGPMKGFSLYYLTSDKKPHFTCTPKIIVLPGGGQLSCTEEWPPLLTTGAPVAGNGVDASLLGSVVRNDIGDTQVTYAGHPLYLFDSSPGSVTGEAWDDVEVRFSTARPARDAVTP